MLLSLSEKHHEGFLLRIFFSLLQKGFILSVKTIFKFYVRTILETYPRTSSPFIHIVTYPPLGTLYWARIFLFFGEAHRIIPSQRRDIYDYQGDDAYVTRYSAWLGGAFSPI